MIGIEIDAREITGLADQLDPRELGKALKAGTKTLSKEAERLFARTVRTWDHKPTFTSLVEVNSQQGTAYFVTGTDSQVYTWVDRGTGIYGPNRQPIVIVPRRPGGALRFQAYKAKTKPGTLTSRSGGPYGPFIFAKRVVVKGIEPRDFTGQVTKEIEKKIPEVILFEIMEWWYRGHPGQQLPASGGLPKLGRGGRPYAHK